MKSPEQLFQPQEINKTEKEEKEIKIKLISKLGSLLHDEWRMPRKKEDGSFEPRVKKTKDESWKKINNIDEVDIANTSYENLPDDWKGENKISAEIAINQIYETIEKGEKLDGDFIENASEFIHNKWLERNGNWAPEEQNKPYGELSEEEKEKDRAIIKKAINIYKEEKTPEMYQPTPEKKNTVVENFKDKNINEVKNLLSTEGISPEKIEKIINLIYKEVSESTLNIIMPDKVYGDIAENADSEWRDIRELARINASSKSQKDFATELISKFPDLEVKFDNGLKVKRPL